MPVLPLDNDDKSLRKNNNMKWSIRFARIGGIDLKIHITYLDAAFAKMQECGCPHLPVIDAFGRLAGLLTPENAGEMMIIKSLRPREGKPSWRLAQA